MRRMSLGFRAFRSCVLLLGLLACSPDRPGAIAEGHVAETFGDATSGVADGSSGAPSSETASSPNTTDPTASVGSEDADGTQGSVKFDIPGAGSGAVSASHGDGVSEAGGESSAEECVPSSQKEDFCDDGLDDDCDGMLDCDDPDCIWGQKCLGCVQLGGEVCFAGADEDCDGLHDCSDPDCIDAPDCTCREKCVPGQERWCDGPPRCSWGRAVCTPGRTWGLCMEVGDERPQGCEHTLGLKFDPLCCAASPDACCQDYPNNRSMGECEGIAECTAPPDDDTDGSTTNGMPPDDEPTASASTTSTTTGPPDR